MAEMFLNGIQHLISVSYQPASTGLTERAVNTFKNAMIELSGGLVQEWAHHFLFPYQVTLQSMTRPAKAELLFNQ